jgi:hypothetical protein
MDDWQPIETAPKDGSPVYTRGNNGGDPHAGTHVQWAQWTGDAWDSMHDDSLRLIYLTHYCPAGECGV